MDWEPIVVERYERAEQLLRALWRHDLKRWPEPENWIFRGQGDASWRLTPFAHRLNTSKSLPLSLLEEESIITTFLEELDRQGIAAPTENPFIREINSGMFWYKVIWPTSRIIPSMALAQHYGLPTRLLDWSLRPLVAAYFAASSAVDIAESRQDHALAVWALDTYQMSLAFGFSEAAPPRNLSFAVVRPSRTWNQNLRAQEGVFTLIVETENNHSVSIQGNVPPPLDKLIEIQSFTTYLGIGGILNGPLLRKLELPHSEAGRLLRLLSLDHVSGTYLFPGIDGVVRGLQEKKYWVK